VVCSSVAVMTPMLRAQPPQKREARISRLFLGVLLLFVIGTSFRRPLQGSAGYILGQFIGMLLFAAPAVWLIVSGLPKTLGLNAAQRRERRSNWYRFVGVGLLIMAALFFFFAYLGWPAAAGFVNLVYWIGWTWVSWIFADKKSARNAPSARLVSESSYANSPSR
jgi:hypothetical protein